MISCLRPVHQPCVALIYPEGDRNRGGSSNKKPNRLIFPNDMQQKIPGSRLFIPNQETTSPGRQDAQLVTDVGQVVESDGRRTYQPPMGYFSKQKTAVIESELDPQIMIQKLKAGIGAWYTLATYLPKLAALGYDSVLLEEMTGIQKGEQSIMTIAASVLQSILAHVDEMKKENPAQEDDLSFFDTEGTHFALYELRYLDVEHRAFCAFYVSNRRLDARDTMDLARATKEYFRREEDAIGFAPTPEDILAFKFYRNVDIFAHHSDFQSLFVQALESREEGLIQSFVDKGLEIAMTDSAKERLESISTGHDKILELSKQASKAKIEMYRMLTSDLVFRPIPHAGESTQINCQIFETAPWASQSGEFGMFQIYTNESASPEDSWKWIALPNWPLLSRAKRPVSIALRNCARVEAILASAQAKSDGEIRKLGGPGMLVFDLTQKEIMEDEYFVVKGANDQPDIKSGDHLMKDAGEVIGKVLLLCRPPDKESIDSFEF